MRHNAEKKLLDLPKVVTGAGAERVGRGQALRVQTERGWAELNA